MDFSEELQPKSEEIGKSNSVSSENSYLKEEDNNISKKIKNVFLSNDFKASDIGLIIDTVENIDDFDSDEGYSLDEDDDIKDSDQKVFQDTLMYRKLFSADGRMNINNMEANAKPVDPDIDNNDDLKDINESDYYHDYDNLFKLSETPDNLSIDSDERYDVLEYEYKFFLFCLFVVVCLFWVSGLPHS